MPARLITLAVSLAAAALLPGVAGASELIDRNATNVKLAVSKDGQAALTYRAGGKTKHVLAWGAVNAIASTQSRPQVAFRLDYAGGWGAYRRNVAATMKNTCGPYQGPELKWLVTACTARDGSHWAVQSWQRMLPNYGLRPNAKQAVWELRLSHWTGEIPELQVKLDWAYRKYHHLYGSFTYRGEGVYGFKSTSTGNPLDTFGRNLYLDTFNSAYGAGWKRENSFLMHTGSGKFCYGFFPHGARPAGNGVRYRATIIGPGVTPDIYWEGDAPGEYDREADRIANDDQREFFGAGSQCKPN